MESATVATPREATEAATGSRTIADLFPLAVRKHGSHRAVTYRDEASGEWVSKTYEEVGEIVRALSLGLIDLGIENGDKVAILSNTRPEWSYFDFAALSAGATVVPIYQTNSPEECQYVLKNSDSTAVIVEDDAQLEKIRQVRGALPELEHVIRMTGRSDDAISMQELAARGASLNDADWEERWSSVTPDDICTFIYTSGTTGPPKGCVISHGNYRSMLDMVHSVNVLGEDEVTYLYLPLAHSFALLIQFGTFDLGATLAYWERDPMKIMANLAEVRPTYFPSVPRIFEKIYTAATANVDKEGGVKKRVFWWAIGVGRKVRERARQGKEPGLLLRKQYEIADRQVLSTIRGLFGGNLKLAVSGAAPINPEILRFFDAAGVLVLEGWGMTETSTAATIATPEDFRFGTIGKPFPGSEIRIADDGEILVRGPNVFQGYYKNEEATRETIVDGWLHTGDIGEVDADGYFKITGRKKDIIITAGGKNITPANLENEIKQHPLVSQCVVIGDRRPYLVALVTLDPEEAAKFAAANGLPEDPAALAESDAVRNAISAQIDKVNERYARVEQVKKFKVLPEDLSQEGGELTPTMKVKRNVVADKRSDDIEALYSG
ncbi:MAG TPA: long-chain fatty acid--CoA ligase [Solirubrobacterales bacterium]|nr:long-chain fatty acid--CoA ligase [Solirubrobacterales bacterium]